VSSSTNICIGNSAEKIYTLVHYYHTPLYCKAANRVLNWISLFQAFAEELHERVRRDIWGYSEESLSMSELHRQHYKVGSANLKAISTAGY
jgi:cobalamin-dependent methionine synthase I